jgi:UDP-N-acetylglucosamine--N-acetylmuramyl-(pentapeptide) pyrophosphoryl-undecaprenol N-acetylglucosamine transferase
MTTPLSVLIMAGGTGGHVFPALAVAEHLRARGIQVYWLGTAKGIETNLVPKAGFTLHLIRVEGVRGRGLIGLLKAPFLIINAIFQALAVIRKTQVDVVLGFGGFASGPGGVAAKIAGKPLLIHEQNAVAGTTNRILSHLSARVLSAFDGAFKNAKTLGVEVVGNPVRSSIYQLVPVTERYNTRTQQQLPLHLLVLGGSLGAKAINELVPNAIAGMDVAARPEIWHQSGMMHQETTSALYKHHQLNARVDAFIEDMAGAYGWADMIICRAGALTVSELMAAGVAAALIPLPSAIDDHQTWNARVLTSAGAAVALVQRELTAEKLTTLLLSELSDRHKLMAMAEKAQQLAKPDAVARVAELCVEVARG